MKQSKRRPSKKLCAFAPLRELFLLILLAAAASAQSKEMFSDMAEQIGLDFVYFNGMSGEFYFVEHLGGGVALFDYDKDGDLDVYLTQGHMLGKGKSLKDALLAPRTDQPLTDRLFRNDLVVQPNGRRRLRFSDVTEASGINAPGYGMGVASGDIDNDGWVDLFVTNFGRNQLFRNQGDGTFADVTDKAGVGQPGWGISAAFLDYDKDSHLDLYVANYLLFSLEANKKCYALNGARDYCPPQFFKAATDRLYHNRGDGTFEDVSQKAGITQTTGPGMGVITADFTGDGWVDIYVANDGKPNQLWINQQDGTFKDEAFLAGVAVNMAGTPEASMGVDAADFDADGDEDLFMTHLIGETNTLYVNDGTGWFEDRSLATGLAAPSKAYTSFGTAWFDYDNDAWLDLFIANGDVRIMPILARAGDGYPPRQPNQLFANLGNGRFKESTRQAGEVFELSEVSRGSAIGDLDNDGDSDVVVANNNGPVRVLINAVGNQNHWLGLRLQNTFKQDALGARVEVRRSKGASLWRRVRADGSYASANDPRVLVGLGDSSDIGALRIHWPSGRVEQWTDIAADQYVTLHEGEGRPLDSGKVVKTSRP